MTLPLFKAGNKIKKFIALVALLFLALYHSFSQVSPTTPGSDTMRLVEILRTNSYGFEKIDSLTSLQILVGQVHLKEQTTHFYADSTVINNYARIIEAFGNVHINDNDSVHTYSQYLLYNLDTKIATLKKKVRLTNDKTNLYTEELEYDVNQKIGIYRNGGRVVNGTSVLTSIEGTYYADLKDVYFKNDVVLKDPKYDLQSDSLLYNTTTEIATFISRTFIIDSAKRSIQTLEGYYDLKNKKAFFGKRPIIKDGAVKIIADFVETDDNSGMNKLRGNAVFIDSAQGVSVLANYIESNRNEGWFRATQHPLMILKQDNDSIFITGDTLISGKLSRLNADTLISEKFSTLKPDTLNSGKITGVNADTLNSVKFSSLNADTLNSEKIARLNADTLASGKFSKLNPDTLKSGKITRLNADTLTSGKFSRLNTDTLNSGKINQLNVDRLAVKDTIKNTSVVDIKNDSTDRYFQAFRNVRIFSDSLQAVSDSLFYSGKDSIFKLFQDPIVWANTSQVTGDTIYLFTKNKKAERLHVFENGLVINQSAVGMYNQVKGNRLFGYFMDGVIDYIRAKGNAESVYYVRDEDELLVGINKATGDIIDMRFKNKELNRVVFISDVKGTMYPVAQIPEEEKTLRNFQWHENKRPKTKYELFGN